MTKPRRRKRAPARPANTSRRTLLLVVLAAAAPALVATFLIGVDWRPTGRSQARGELMQPVQTLPAIAWQSVTGAPSASGSGQGKWQLLALADGSCADPCLQSLFAAHQARLMLGKDLRRVERVLLVPDMPAAEYAALLARDPGLLVYRVSAEQYKTLHDFLLTESREVTGWIFLIDPAGNFVLRYAPGMETRDLYKDLARLLRLSQIG